MLQWRARIAPAADFVVAAAEHLPFRSASIDLIVAAGSLNYVDLDRFFPEAARVLEPGGLLIPYDFAAGRNFAHEPGLDTWFAAFRDRYPFPKSEARPLDPTILATIHPAFTGVSSAHFSIPLPMTFPAYIAYMLTETNVAAAVRRGADLAEIKAWCEQTLRPVWNGSAEHEILFPGYFACMRPR
jgi:SAM-dependent methyltransferase